jgi:hypothetical protein
MSADRNPYTPPLASLELPQASGWDFPLKAYSFSPGWLYVAMCAYLYAAALNSTVVAAYHVNWIGEWPQWLWGALVVVGVAALWISSLVLIRLLREKANFTRANKWLWANLVVHVALSIVALANLALPDRFRAELVFNGGNILQGAILIAFYLSLRACPDPLFGLKRPFVWIGLAMGLSLITYFQTSTFQFTVSSTLAAVLSLIGAVMMLRAARSLKRANAAFQEAARNRAAVA